MFGSINSSLVRSAAVKLWPAEVHHLDDGKFDAQFGQTLAMVLAGDPDFRLRVCHLEPLLQLAFGYQLPSTQIQALLHSTDISRYFSVEGGADQEWQQCIVRLHPQILVRDAAEREAVNGQTNPDRANHTNLVQSAISTWSMQLHSNDGKVGLLAALAILANSSNGSFTMHLSDLAASICQLLATSSEQLAPLLPSSSSWAAPDAASLQDILNHPVNQPYFQLSPPTATSEAAATLLAARLTSPEASPWQHQQPISSTATAAAPDDPVHPPLPAFLFEFDSSEQSLPKPASEAKPGAPETSSLARSSSGMIPAFLPDPAATAAAAAAAAPAGLLQATSSCSLDHFSDATESIIRNSAFHHPSSWSSSHSGEALFKSHYKPFTPTSLNGDSLSSPAAAPPHMRELFPHSDSLFSSPLALLQQQQVPKAIASCWQQPQSEGEASTPTSWNSSPLEGSNSGPMDVLADVAQQQQAAASVLPGSASATGLEGLAASEHPAPVLHHSASAGGLLHQQSSARSCTNSSARLRSPSPAAVAAAAGSSPGRPAAAAAAAGRSPQSWSAVAAKDPRNAPRTPPHPPTSTAAAAAAAVLGRSSSSSRPPPPSTPNGSHAAAAAAAAAAAGHNGHVSGRSPRPGAPPAISSIQKGDHAKLASKVQPKVRDEILRLVEELPGLSIEDFDDGVIYQLNLRGEGECVAALRSLAEHDLSNIQHMAAFVNFIVKNHGAGDGSGNSSLGPPGMLRGNSTPVSTKAMLQKLPARVYRRLEDLVATCAHLDWKHFDAGVVKVLGQLARIGEGDVLEELALLESSDLSNVEYMPAYLNKRLNNRLWSRRKSENLI